MRLIPLEIGRLDAKLSAVTGEDGTVALPVISWLVEHARGLVLFDTGMHASLQSSTKWIGRSAESFRPDFSAGAELSARIRGVGIDPADISHVVFSHLHFDHAGGTCEVPNARLIVQAAEWQAGADPRRIELGIYNPADFDLGHAVETIEGEHDLFGDGRVVCVPTPGHTPGHQALRVGLESGPVVLTGDCIYFERMLTEMRTPNFGHDLEQQHTSMRALVEMRDREGCRLLFGHDAAQLAAIPEKGLH